MVCCKTSLPRDQWQNNFLSSFVYDEYVNIACEFVSSFYDGK